MTSIAANSANKHLADFGGTKKQHRVSTAVKKHQNEEFDDGKSEMSYLSQATSSNFSSVLQRGRGINPMIVGGGGLNDITGATIDPHQTINTSVAPSMISYEDSVVNADFNAVTEEERARRRKEEKEMKLKEFMSKTKKNAQTKLQQDLQTKQSTQIEQQMKDRERALKAKDYARKQREIIKHQVETKKAQQMQLDVSHHVQFKKDVVIIGGDTPEIIPETNEEHNQSSTFQAQEDLNLPDPQLVLIDQFQRIDQLELEKIGVADKKELTQEAIPQLHSFTMLQRFRQGRDFKVPDNTVKQGKKKQVSFDKENKFWLSNNQPQTKEAAQKDVDKQRYIKALKAMVQEKGIPNLCSCSAASDPSKKNSAPPVCASNCQYYKNEKEYERALRDLLASSQ